MIRQRSILLSTLVIVILGTAVHAQAQEPIRFARTPDISPDGKHVAFSYLGDIWIVETIGGVARHVTMHEKHDFEPVFSPDGRHLAFSSNRHGSYDVFVVPVQGGRPKRLTHDSADDHVTGWSPDGKKVLFSSSRAAEYPFGYNMYTVPVSGGRAERIGLTGGREGVFSPKGDDIAYVRGPGTWYRKGYRGSSNDDIWLCKADGSNHRAITNFNGQDNSPMWAPDGKNLYYVTEMFGTPANIVRQELDVKTGAVKSPPVPLTSHKDEAVRRARISGNGEWIVYECGADLWVVATTSGAPRKLAIECNADDKTNSERVATFTSGATEFAVSFDEKFVTFGVHGELFMMPITGGKARRLTDNPAYDHSAVWSRDSKKIIFLSDRGGQEDVYLLEPDDPDHPELTKAQRFKTKQLTNTPEEEFGLNFSPDSKRISFIRSGKLYTMNADGTDLKTIVKEGQVFDYEWSPDSKWLCYARMDGSFASELYIVPADGPTAADPARNVTRFATYNGGVTWSMIGNRIAFIGQRRQNTFNVCVLSLQRPAVPGTSPSKDIDWDDIHLRVTMPTTMNVNECAISPEASRVAFRGVQDSVEDLWVASSDGSQITRLTTGNMRPTQLQWSKKGFYIYFRDNNGNIRYSSVPGLSTTSTTSTTTIIPFTARMVVKRDEEFAEMFEQAWRALRENFYDAKFHGANWDAVRDKYRPLIKHCALKEDLYSLVSLMLGELNASHLGISPSGAGLTSPEQTTAELGLLYDPAYRGPGLKIREVLKRGPADRRGINLKSGDIILSIDRHDIADSVDLATLLNDKVGETVSLQVTTNPADAKDRRRVEVPAVSRNTITNLMYDRWVALNAKRVTELSKGKLGYIHIPSMNEFGLDRFVRSLYSDNFDKDAIVIDVRYNGGGYTHDQVLNYLGGKEHTLFQQRYGGQGFVLRSSDRKWTKPLIVLINNYSFSDAEIFPHAFRTLGLGKLVGQPTGGAVIGTGSVRLIDGSTFRIPRIGVITVKGVNMEKEGVRPDYLIEQHPDELARGKDTQLEKAVEVLQQEVIAWKKAKNGGAAVSPGDTPAPEPEVRRMPKADDTVLPAKK
jgi:tricorn protease